MHNYLSKLCYAHIFFARGKKFVLFHFDNFGGFNKKESNEKTIINGNIERLETPRINQLFDLHLIQNLFKILSFN